MYKKKSGKSRSAKQTSGKKYVKQCAAVVLLTVIIYAVLLALAAFVVSRVNTPHSLFGTLSTGCIGASHFFSAFAISKRRKENGLITGAASGVLLFMIIALIGAIIKRGMLSLNALVKLVILVCTGAMGGMLGVNSSVKKRIR